MTLLHYQLTTHFLEDVRMPLQPTETHLMTTAVPCCCSLPLSMAQAWPARPIRLVVRPPGGLMDNIGSTGGQQALSELGQPVVIDKPGAGAMWGRPK